ncbi:aquaporin Z [Spirosoma flavus]
MKKNLAECIGAFALVLFGCGAAGISGITSTGPAGIGLLGISLAFGLTVVVMAYAIGPISGCHINPAITIAMLLVGKIKASQAIGYIVAQFLGATLAAGVLYVIQRGAPGFLMTEWALGSNGWGPGYLGGYNTTSAFITETVMTFMFILVIFKTTATWGNSTMAGLAIGLTLVLVHLVAIPITGTSVNPARSFGPALLAGGKALQQLWLFMIAPVLGSLLAALTWKNLFENAVDMNSR